MNFILGMAVLSLLIGLGLYIWLVRSNASYFYSTNVVCWLLMALFPVLVLFSFFPESTISGEILGFSMTGALAAFIFIWIYGSKRAKQAFETDAPIEKIRTELTAKLLAQEKDLQELRDFREKFSKQRVPSVLREQKIHNYTLKKKPDKEIAIITGDIQSVNIADIWVNSENANMQVSRYYERSISGVIRYLGAKKDITGHVMEDTIANELKQVMDKNLVVQPATVLVTGSGELQRTHRVKKIFHVASVQGTLGFGYQPIPNIEACVTNSLMKADCEEFREVKFRSILFPLMGTGTARGDLKEIAERLIHSAISYLERTDNSTIERVYFLAWTDVELETCMAILDGSDALVRS